MIVLAKFPGEPTASATTPVLSTQVFCPGTKPSTWPHCVASPTVESLTFVIPVPSRVSGEPGACVDAGRF